MTWTPELVEALRRMWTEGRSASEIAGELRMVTRNAVIGKVHRLGLSRQDKSQQPRTPGKPKHKPHVSMVRFGRPPKSRYSVPLWPPLESRLTPAPRMLALSELTARTCRWPIGDPRCGDFGFCGHPCRQDQSYCEHHSLLSSAVRAPQRQRRQAVARNEEQSPVRIGRSVT
jgi:GcrA cell cycle regulator